MAFLSLSVRVLRGVDPLLVVGWLGGKGMLILWAEDVDVAEIGVLVVADVIGGGEKPDCCEASMLGH